MPEATNFSLLGMVPSPVRNVLRVLEDHGHSAHLVGGSVRDLLQGKPVHDFDVATDARPERVMALFDHTIPTGIRHGTVTVRADQWLVEVTTYRVDLGYSDGRRPDAVRFADSIEEDLGRRDFTINAMALDLRGVLTDPFGGQDDLRQGVIRTVGEPAARFAEDGLRILRALRFAAQLGFRIDQQTLAGMHQEAHRLRAVSMERVGSEWIRIACSGWERIAPLLADGPWLDLWPTPISCWRQAFAAGPFDTGTWPVARRLWAGEDEVMAAFSLAVWSSGAGLSEAQVRQVGRTLAWNREIVRVAAAAVTAYRALTQTEPSPRWSWLFWEFGPVAVQMAATLADGWRGHRSLPTYRRCRRAQRTQPLWSIRDLQVRGSDLKGWMAGPDIGHTLTWLVEQVLNGKLPNRREALLAAVAAKMNVPDPPETSRSADQKET